ncbi:MAG TPA: HNH endonuclease [Acidimicrobiia bacterium]
MDWERDLSESSTDEREARFVESARLISQLQAGLLDDLEWFDTAQVFNADGARSLSEWVAQKLDVSADTARGLVRTMRRTQNKPHLREALAAGVVSFDRAEALSRIEDEKDLLQQLDIAGVYRTAADRVEITSEDEVRSAADQYLIMQPSLDESWWQIRGGLDGLTGAVIDRALTEKADQLPDLPDGTTGSLGWRRAIALYELASGGQTPTAKVTVFVNAEQAVPSNGRAGVWLQAGPRVGPQALEAVLCDAFTEVTINSADGIPMRYGLSSRPVPPALSRAMMNTTGGTCGIDGCNSRYRVEVHHKVPFSEGGPTDPENLLPLCWFHHHIVIHQRGFELFRHPDHGRWRLRSPEPDADSTKPKG